MLNRYEQGTWAAVCDRCGTKHKAHELILDHDNYRVCLSCYEPEHPNEHIRVPRENPGVPWARPVSYSNFVPNSGIGVWIIGVNFKIPPRRDVQALTVDGETVRVTCMGHTFASLDTITMRGAVDSGYNGSYEITVLDEDHFIYTASPSANEDPAVSVTADGILKDVNLATFNRWHTEEWEAS